MIQNLAVSSKKLLLLLCLLAMVVSFGAVTLSMEKVGAIMSGAEVNSRKYYAFDPVAADKTCYDRMKANRAQGMAPRPAINNSGPYTESEWISPAGSPSAQSIDVPYGTTAINLQVNKLTFLCSSLVQPDGKGADYAYDPSLGLVTPGAYPNDRIPNPAGGNTNWPARRATQTYIMGMSSTAGSISNLSSQFLNNVRKEDSRYWFADSPATFQLSSNSPKGFTENITVTVEAKTKVAARYAGSSLQCEGAPAGSKIQTVEYASQCVNNINTLRFTLSLRVIDRPYSIVPRVDASNDVAYPGNQVTFTHITDASGSVDRPVDLAVYDVVLPPGSTKDQLGVQNNVSNVCATFAEAGATCNQRGKGTVGTMSPGTTAGWFSEYSQVDVPDNIPVGTKICRVLTVDPAERSGGMPGDIVVSTRVSAPRCAVVAKKPKVQIHGGDIRVGGKIETSTTAVKGRSYGSWAEYGVFAKGKNMLLASGSGYSGGTTESNANVSRLTFANQNPDGSYGNFSWTDKPALANQFAALSSGGTLTGTVNLGAIEAGAYSATNVTISGGSVGQDSAGNGRTVVIVASGTVTINGDITYEAPNPDGTFTSSRQLPQVIIIAHRINIAGSVGTIDSWLLTTGTSADRGRINTCSDVSISDPLTANVCNNRLTVNGPVATSELHLRRTAGSDTGETVGDPAEVFNLRPDVYLWGSGRASAAGKAQTMYSVELPPRY